MSDPSTDRPAPRLGHVPALDGLRAIAVMLVVYHHAWGKRPPVGTAETIAHTVMELGWMGVDLFFVLSGFLITRILLRHRDAPNLLKAFWWRRIVRIMPLYYSYLSVCFFVLPAFGIHRFSPGPRAQFYYLTFLSNLWITFDGIGKRQSVHLWSVSVEEQFYLFWPFVVLAARGPWLGRVIVGILVLTPLARGVGGLLGVPWMASYILTPLRMDGLAWGALLAVLWTLPGGLARHRRTAAWVGSTALVAGIAWVAWVDSMRPDEGTWWMQATLYAITGAGFAAVLARVLTEPEGSRLTRWLSHPWMTAIGTWSYAIYVLHPMLLVLSRSFGLAVPHSAQGLWWYVPAQLAYTTGIAIVSIGAGALSWRLLESRFLALKDRVPYLAPPADRPSRDEPTA